MREELAGFRVLYKVTLKHDARNIAPWILLISVLSVTSVLAYGWIFPDALSRAVLAQTVGANPAFGLIFGPPRNLDTAEGFNTWRALALGGFFSGLMAILIVVRHTRAGEDSGQAELVASGVVGRYTRLAVAVGLAVQASFALGVVCTLLTRLVGGAWVPTTALAATFTASGLMFAGVAAVTAQIGSYARTSSSMAITFLGVCFLVRGYADASDHEEWARLSPLGWTQAVRPGADNDWRPLLYCLAFTIVLLAVANAMLARRDFGMGLVPPSPGPDRGGRAASIGGLALRLHRDAMISWTLAFVVLGGVFGLLSTSLGDVFGRNPMVAMVIASGAVSQSSLTFEFLVTILKLLGIIAAVYGAQVMMRVWSEEVEHRAEPLLAGAVARPRYLLSNVAVALVGPAVAMVVGATVIGLIAQSRNSGITLADVVGQTIAEIPAVWVLIGVSIAAVGAHPRVRIAGWLAIVASFALTILGPMFRLWDWILGISPLFHVPRVTSPSPEWGGLLGVSAVAVVLLVAGFAGYRRRDVS